jgi:hypothetical protein
VPRNLVTKFTARKLKRIMLTHCQGLQKGLIDPIMKRAAEYTGVDDNGAPLKKHDDDGDIDVHITRIRDEMVVTQQAISSLNTDLRKQQQRYARLERELLEAVSAKERALQKEREDFELATQRITTTVTTNPVKLDVGGRIFSVTLDMMLKYPDSFFARLFSGRWEDKKTDYRAYFIIVVGGYLITSLISCAMDTRILN